MKAACSLLWPHPNWAEWFPPSTLSLYGVSEPWHSSIIEASKRRPETFSPKGRTAITQKDGHHKPSVAEGSEDFAVGPWASGICRNRFQTATLYFWVGRIHIQFILHSPSCCPLRNFYLSSFYNVLQLGHLMLKPIKCCQKANWSLLFKNVTTIRKCWVFSNFLLRKSNKTSSG